MLFIKICFFFVKKGNFLSAFAYLFWLLPNQLFAQNESIFYQVIHPQTKAESYILGTFHTYPEGWYQIPDDVKNKLIKCDNLITEIGIPNSENFKKKVAKIVRYKSGKTVLDKLNSSTKDRFKQYLNDNIGGSESFKKSVLNYKPYFMFGNLFALRFSDTVMRMETQFENLAKLNQIPILSLEPNENQIISYYRKYANSVKPYNLDIITETRMQSTSKMFKLYLNGDINGMVKVFGNAGKMAKERNNYWAPQLVNMLRKPSFVAVGTGHLIGGNAIQELLKKEGFIVKPIALSHPLPKQLDEYLSK
jgi:uncharacterized protein YbaP (TraB family)